MQQLSNKHTISVYNQSTTGRSTTEPIFAVFYHNGYIINFKISC